jgi:hypothetical protein
MPEYDGKQQSDQANADHGESKIAGREDTGTHIGGSLKLKKLIYGEAEGNHRRRSSDPGHERTFVSQPGAVTGHFRIVKRSAVFGCRVHAVPSSCHPKSGLGAPMAGSRPMSPGFLYP